MNIKSLLKDLHQLMQQDCHFRDNTMTKNDPYEVYAELVKQSNELMDSMDIGPLELAASYMTHAMRIYRTVLPEEDYHKMMTSIYKSRHKIGPIERPVLH